MGAEPWSYFVPYREDVHAALDALRKQEFEAGRYRLLDPDETPSTAEAAFEMSEAGGTASILDMFRVADEPDFCCVSPLSRDELIDLFGTDRPTHRMIEENMDFYESIERGHGIYITIYDGDRPTELFFAGYSFD
jgi:hypothetical protein